MRRPVAHTAVLIAVAISLLVPSASTALAFKSPSFLGRNLPLARYLPSRLRTIFDRPLVANKAQDERALGARFRVPGSPYQWEFDVERSSIGRPGWTLFIAGSRNASVGGGQLHEWVFHLPLGAAAVGSQLRDIHVHTAAALGSFGKIDLTFHSARRLQHWTEHCQKTHALLGVFSQRGGTMHGSFSFTPREGSLPDLSLQTMKAFSGLALYTGAGCEYGGGHRPCTVQSAFRLSDPAQSAGAEATVAFPTFPDFNKELEISTRRQVGPALEEHFLLAVATETPVAHLTPSGVVIRSSELHPFVSGSIRFESGATAHRLGDRCKIATTHETWASGTLTGHLDSGDIQLTGGDLLAALIAYTRP